MENKREPRVGEIWRHATRTSSPRFRIIDIVDTEEGRIVLSEDVKRTPGLELPCMDKLSSFMYHFRRDISDPIDALEDSLERMRETL